MIIKMLLDMFVHGHNPTTWETDQEFKTTLSYPTSLRVRWRSYLKETNQGAVHILSESSVPTLPTSVHGSAMDTF